MIDELKPVPCGCGGEAKVESANGYDPFAEKRIPNLWYGVICKKCKIQTKSYYTEAEAVTAWNRAMGAKDINVPNKERTAKVERTSVKNTYICSNCGRPMHPVDFSMPNKYCGFCGAKLDWSGNDEKA